MSVEKNYDQRLMQNNI